MMFNTERKGFCVHYDGKGGELVVYSQDRYVQAVPPYMLTVIQLFTQSYSIAKVFRTRKERRLLHSLLLIYHQSP